jgi:hypothetical protein
MYHPPLFHETQNGQKEKYYLDSISYISILRLNLVIPTLVGWMNEGYMLKLMLNEHKGEYS